MPEMVALPPFELLRVEGLHASYDGPTEVLHGVSIEVREHEIVTVLGSNGAGKTTLVAAVMGLVPHVRGRIRFQGEDITALPPHAIVGRGIIEVPTGREVFPDQTVEENLLLGAHSYRRDRARVRRNLEDMKQRFPESSVGGPASSPARCRAASSRSCRSPGASWAAHG